MIATRKNISTFIGILLILSCSSPKHLPKPKDFKYHVKGLHMELVTNNDVTILGEIIEAKSDSVKILPLQINKRSITTISKNDIKKADVIISLTSDDPKKISTWGGLLNITSIGHGFFGLFTLPINLLATSSMSNSAAKGNYRMKYPNDVSWEMLKKFARFPQGIPSHIKLEDIQ